MSAKLDKQYNSVPDEPEPPRAILLRKPTKKELTALLPSPPPPSPSTKPRTVHGIPKPKIPYPKFGRKNR